MGPDSAGADPGPACYRRGGPLAVTDANVMLGRIQPAHFPAMFGPRGDQPLDADAVRARFTALAREIHESTGDDRTPNRSPRAICRSPSPTSRPRSSGSPCRRATTSRGTP
ncbi:hydantoinase/oxoprolinase family protein [Streptomyces thermocarboxydus]